MTDRLPVVELIGATTTKTGLKVDCALDTRTYQKGIKVSNAEMKALNITGDRFHPEWNYKTLQITRGRRAPLRSECERFLIGIAISKEPRRSFPCSKPIPTPPDQSRPLT